MPTKKQEKTKETNVKNKKTTQKIEENFVLSKQTYSENVLKQFANFSIKNTSTIIIAICALIILACAVVMLVSGSVLYGVIYLLIGLFFAFYPLLIKLIMKRQNKNNLDTTDEYKFFDDKVEITSLDKTGKQFATATVVYARLFKVRTHKNYGYIYFNKQMAYIISKENFKNEEEFNAVLNKISEVIEAQKQKN